MSPQPIERMEEEGEEGEMVENKLQGAVFPIA